MIVDTDFWTPWRVARLLSLREQGASYAVCAADLGCTRSAISGKLARMREKKAT